MRSSKSRSRSKANRPRTLGNIINRVFDSSGPEGKVRGTPQQIIEKYQILARDAQLSNDRVAAENFMQHAEHYTRMLSEAMREMAAEQEARQQQPGPYNQGQGNQGQNNQNHNNQGQNNPGQNNQGGGRRDDRDGSWNGNGNGGNGNGGSNGGDRRENRGDYRPDYRNDQRGDQPRSDQRPPRGEDGPRPGVDVIDLGGDDAGLVETPEARAPRRDDRPAEPEAPAVASAAPEAEAPAETRAPRRPRGPRKPRAEKAGDAGGDDKDTGSGPREAAE